MKLYRFEDASQFYDRMKDYLVNHEALHNVMLGLCNALIYNPERFHEKPYLADVEIDGDIAAVAMRIPPKGLMLSQVKDLRAVEAIAQNLHLTQKLLPGVNAPTASAKAFAEVWYSLSSQFYQIKMALRAFQLEQVQPISHALGDLRLAQSGDRQLLMHWYAAFLLEALGSVESVERVVDRHLQQGTAYLWDNETPVSMASRVGVLGSVWCTHRQNTGEKAMAIVVWGLLVRPYLTKVIHTVFCLLTRQTQLLITSTRRSATRL